MRGRRFAPRSNGVKIPTSLIEPRNVALRPAHGADPCATSSFQPGNGVFFVSSDCVMK